jgi:hypothetical protein
LDVKTGRVAATAVVAVAAVASASLLPPLFYWVGIGDEDWRVK